MKWLIILIVLLAFAGFGVFFGQLNDQPVTVDLFVMQQEFSAAVWLALAFFSGVFLSGVMVYLNMWLVVQRRVKQARKTEQAKASTALAEVQQQSTPALQQPTPGNDPAGQ